MRTIPRTVAQALGSVSLRCVHPLADHLAAPVRGPQSLEMDSEDITEAAAGVGTAAAGQGSRDERMRRVEALLFLTREPLSTRKLGQFAGLADATEARTLVRQLNERLDESGRAFRVEEVAGGYQLMTRPKFAAWLRRLASVPKEVRLSAPALETLAVIAYRQPTGRAEIEAVRGVNCGEIMRQLMDRDLVKIAGRSEELGRPYLYATTRRFLQLFGLRSLEDLPRADQLRNPVSSPNSDRHLSDRTEIRNTTVSLDTQGTESPELGPPHRENPNRENPDSSNSPDRNSRNRNSPDRNEEETDVTATIRAELSPEELRKPRLKGVPMALPRASDDESEDFEEEEEDDDFDDLDDDEEEDDFDDEEDEEDGEEFDDDEDFEEDEWEEVDDEDEDEEFEDEEDEEWEDDDDEDDADEEEEEDEDWE